MSPAYWGTSKFDSEYFQLSFSVLAFSWDILLREVVVDCPFVIVFISIEGYIMD
jgi:hypothetical protein